MLSERQLRALLVLFDERMQGITSQYLAAMGEHIKNIGSLLPSDVHRLTEMRRSGLNTERIQREIVKSAEISVADLNTVFRAVAESNQQFAEQWFGSSRTPRVKGAPQLSTPIERSIKAQLRVTAQAFKNLSQTTIQSGAYQNAVDAAVSAVQSGVTDYTSAIRNAVREAGRDGLRVQYPSGVTRRLDTAVRQNVLDGVRSLNNDILQQLGNEYGADGIELSAHALCAEDHLPYQGKQFSTEDFAQLQNTLERPFGQWNCRHTMFPIILGVSKPVHTPEELAAYARNSQELIEIDGRTKTRYEWTQEQRRIETAIRQQKDVANLAKACGDDTLRREAQANINALQNRYAQISKAAGLAEQPQRMNVAGFRSVKVDPNLTFIKNDAKIKAESGLPKILKGLPDEVTKATAAADFPCIHGVVPKGTEVTSIVVMAGNQTSTPIHDLNRLYNSYPSYGRASDWQKKAGTAKTDNFAYELHWYESNGKVPPAEIKVKRVR